MFFVTKSVDRIFLRTQSTGVSCGPPFYLPPFLLESSESCHVANCAECASAAVQQI